MLKIATYFSLDAYKLTQQRTHDAKDTVNCTIIYLQIDMTIYEYDW